jgi:effector-binding domain-containing protein
MSHEPHILKRQEQAYVALTEHVGLDELPDVVGSSFATLSAWLTDVGLSPRGAPFVRYIEVDMEHGLLIEMGMPIEGMPPPDDRVHLSWLPAGEYVVLLHRGPFEGLVSANAAVLDWGARHGVRWAMDSSTKWRARIEQYITDPGAEPDPARWETEISYLVDQ